MITTDSTRMRSPHSALCALRLAGPALPGSGVATYVKANREQFGDRTPTTGPPRGASG